MRKFLAVCAATLCLVVLGASNADAAGGRRHSANHVLVSPAGRHSDLYSTNWSGYAVPAKAGEKISAVTGSWVVPMIRPMPPGESSSWLGIGGFNTQDLIQVGTSSNGRLDDTYAWFEVLPAYESRITSGCSGDASCRVVSGDRMAASVTNNGGDSWTIMLANLGQGGPAKWYWGKTLGYPSTQSSAEWVFEAPQKGFAVNAPLVGGRPVFAQTLPAHAKSAKFFGGTYHINGVVKNVRPDVVTRIFMTDKVGIVPEATPSDMAVDGHFQVCAYSFSCKNF
jgi:hypothetical protein